MLPAIRVPRRRRSGALGLALAVTVLVQTSAAQAADVLFFAAASLRNAFEAVADRYRAETGGTVTFSFAASSSLAKQIEQGAPADLFASADLDWMDYLAKRNLIEPETRIHLLSNRLVLVAPADRSAAVVVGPGFPLAAMLGDGRLAVGDPAHVPAGKYAKAALEHLGVWAAVEPRLARADNVRAALALVARGEAPFGIVYETDARVEKGVKVAAVFPPDTHDPIVYPVARVAGGGKPEAAAFLAYIRSPGAMALFREHGFLPANPVVN